MNLDQILARLANAPLPWELAANVLLQTTLILAAGLVAGRLCRSAGAAVQSLVYRSTLLAVFLCPFFAYGLSAAGFDRLLLNVEQYLHRDPIDLQVAADLPDRGERVESSPIALPLSAQIDSDTLAAAAEADAVRITSTPPIHRAEIDATASPVYEPLQAAPPPIDDLPQGVRSTSAGIAVILALLAGLAWLAASLYLLTRLSLAHLRTIRLRRLAIPADAAEVALCFQLAAEFRVGPPEVLRAPFLSGACLVGYWRPAILLPDSDETPLRQALLHELAHLSRHDCLWNLLRQLATALLPVQPLVWLLAKRVEQTAEEVCDDFVVHYGADRCHYAEHLVELASRNLTPALPAGVGMISFRSLSARRIARILDASRELSTRVGRRTIAATLLTAIAGTLLTASLGIGAGKAAQEQEPGRRTENKLAVSETDSGDGAETNNAVTMRGKGADREMLVKGRVVDAHGQPAQNYELLVTGENGAVSPQIVGDRFEVWVPIGASSLDLSVSTRDGSQRAFHSIRGSSHRQAAIQGVELVLAKASRRVEIAVTKNGAAVPHAHVMASLQGATTLRGQTNDQGKAVFHLLQHEQFMQLSAWTSDFKVGGFAFYRKPWRDPRGTEFTIELEDCRDQTVRFVRADDGSPIAGVPFTLIVGTGEPNYNFAGDRDTLPESKMTTNDKGEAVYRWFPDWERHALEVHILDPLWAKAESNEMIKIGDDGKLVVKLKRRAERKPFVGRVTAGGVDVGGLLVEIRSFQGEEENRSDIVHAVTDQNGSFTADILPGATYCLFVEDERFVSSIIDLIPYDPETGKSNTVLLHVSEGEPVEIRVTAGPRRLPMPHELVHLWVQHYYSWRENGEARRGGGGRKWNVLTDDHGIARVRALAGSELVVDVNAGEWRSPEQKITVEPGGAILDFHREITTAREVTGQLIAPPGMKVDLAHAEIVLESIDGQTDERYTAKTDEQGRFMVKTKALEFGIFAYTADGKAAGIALSDDASEITRVQLAPTADQRGRLLGKNDRPLVGHAVRAEVKVRAKERRRDVSFGTSFTAKTFATKTDRDGNYTLKGLPTQLAITLRADAIDNSEYDAHVADVFLQVGEERPPIVSRLGRTHIEVDQTLPEQYQSLLRDATLGDFHLMVLVFDSAASEFVNANLLDYDKTKEVGSFMHLQIGESDLADAAAVQFAKARDWSAPKAGIVVACAYDASGKELGRTELNISEGDAPTKAEGFIKKHAPPQADAQKKWDAAFAAAKRSNRKVWARVSQRYCGPCFLMARWLDDHRELLARDYVLLKIDNVRDKHGVEVANRIVGDRSQWGIPFHAIFGADEKLLIDSEGPLGNIGHPSGYEGRRHLKKMLTQTRANLSPEQVEELVNSLKE